MLIGILSDTHDRNERTRLAVSMLVERGAEILLHCGDLTRPEIVMICQSVPSFYVLGNNDNSEEIRSAIQEVENANCLGWKGEIRLAGKRIAIAHGHRPNDLHQLLSTNPDYLLSGHSHVAHDFREGITRRINPGALHRAAKYSVALLNLVTDELSYLPIPA